MAGQAQQGQHAIIVSFFLVLQGSPGTTVAECNHNVVHPGFAWQGRHNSGRMQSQCRSSWFCRAVQAQQWQDAVKMYTLAITACADAPPVFAAVLHSNRAAVHQHLDQYTDAVADSLRAKALDPSYAKVTPLQHHALPCWICCSHCVHQQMRQLPNKDCRAVVVLAVSSLWLLQKPWLVVKWRYTDQHWTSHQMGNVPLQHYSHFAAD